jgi:hypothetical protein
MDNILSKRLIAICEEALERVREEIARNIDEHGLTASGATAASMRVVTNAAGATLYGRRYFGVLETGRRPGRVPVNFVDIIKRWMLDKGIPADPMPYTRLPSARWKPKYTPAERGFNNKAARIAYSIRERGTRLYRDGGNPVIFTPPVRAIIAETRETLLLAVRENIIENLEILQKSRT